MLLKASLLILTLALTSSQYVTNATNDDAARIRSKKKSKPTPNSNRKDDLIKELPDFGKTKTPHYSGYLDGSAGCDTETNGELCQIHYWMALAETSPKDAPVVLW